MDKLEREVMEGLLELASQPHYLCDEMEVCEAEGYGDGNRGEHEVLEKARQILEKEENNG